MPQIRQASSIIFFQNRYTSKKEKTLETVWEILSGDDPQKNNGMGNLERSPEHLVGFNVGSNSLQAALFLVSTLTFD